MWFYGKKKSFCHQDTKTQRITITQAHAKASFNFNKFAPNEIN